jgi:hypothetical protein
MAGFLSENRPIRTLREILTRLRETYCGNIGFEVGAAIVLPWPSRVKYSVRCLLPGTRI